MVPWLEYTMIASSVTPVGNAASDLVDYLLSYGVLGLFTLAAAVIIYRGLLIPAARARSDQDMAVTAARADLLKENQRLVEEKHTAEEQRDDALRIARDQIVPLLAQFTATSSALIPLLQELVRNREGIRDRDTG